MLNLKRELVSPTPGTAIGDGGLRDRDVKPQIDQLLRPEGGVATAHDLDEVAEPVGSVAVDQFCGGVAVPTTTLILRRDEGDTDAELDVDEEADSSNRCDDCGVSYPSAVQRLQHQCAASFMCSMCGWRSPSLDQLQKHEVMVHRVDKKFECGVCSARFAKKWTLETHARVHAKARSVCACLACGANFNSQINLRRHRRQCRTLLALPDQPAQAAQAPAPDVKPCVKPGTKRAKKVAMKPEQVLEAPEVPDTPDENEEPDVKPIKKKIMRTFHCKLCLASFWSRLKMQRHVAKIHTMKHLFKCDTCVSSFSTLKGLGAHRRVHNVNRPYTCSLCFVSFDQSEQLMDHLKVHLAPRRQIKKEFRDVLVANVNRVPSAVHMKTKIAVRKDK